MALITDLELPSLDVMDAELRGPRFHDTMLALRDRTWLAQAPFGYVVLDREAAAFFLRTRSATFPGMKIAELFGIDSGPLREEMERNILHIDGADHSRLRNLVNPAFTPRAADRWRPPMRGLLHELLRARQARVPRGAVRVRRRGRALRARGRVRQAVPVVDHRDGDGRAAVRRA